MQEVSIGIIFSSISLMYARLGVSSKLYWVNVVVYSAFSSHTSVGQVRMLEGTGYWRFDDAHEESIHHVSHDIT